MQQHSAYTNDRRNEGRSMNDGDPMEKAACCRTCACGAATYHDRRILAFSL
ncbi:Uncharacterised protein [Bacteroides xylanisolvens]|nr:Uncharacterised protein [Bacteroides xylanisolvens]